jgi:hypothetical protein
VTLWAFPPARVGRKSSKIALVVLAAATLWVSAAHAELTSRGDLFVRFSGDIAPTTLPRTHRAPIAVRLAGTIRTLSGARPPALRQINIALGRGGHLDSRGLPRCRIGQLLGTAPAEALAACGDALLGHGSYRAATAYPEQPTFPTTGRVLAFNARLHGHPAILAHIYGTDPASISRVVVFHIHRTSGAFATVLRASLPPSLNRYGYLQNVALHLHRTYTYRGRTHSYLSAACATPPGILIASFTFARASMTFADGRTLSSTLTRTCRVAP